MHKVEIRNNEQGRPCHAFPRHGGTFTLCARNAALCVRCKEDGVPIVPVDPFQLAVDLFKEHWAKPWRERFWPVPEQAEKGVLKPRRGAHIIALDGQGKDLIPIDLGWFGGDEDVMTALGALVTAHNDIVANRIAVAPCEHCQGTGATDFAGFAMDPCDHQATEGK
ncbi:MAG: hypothetical protein QM690_17180 [Sphingobium sp.]